MMADGQGTGEAGTRLSTANWANTWTTSKATQGNQR